MKALRKKPILRWQMLALLALSALSITGIDATSQKQIAKNTINSKVEFASLIDPRDIQNKPTRPARLNPEDPNAQF